MPLKLVNFISERVWCIPNTYGEIVSDRFQKNSRELGQNYKGTAIHGIHSDSAGILDYSQN